MKFSASAIVLVSSTLGAAQGVTSTILPVEPAPSGCSASADSRFKITVIEPSKTYSSKQDSSSCDNDALLVLSLNNGVLTDAHNRTGYIASNRQFQFDAPPQSGALLTAGFSVCGNGSLALGGSTVWYQCQSGDFSNLYDANWAQQCEPIHLNAVDCGTNGNTTAGSDGGAVNAAVALPVCEIGDGQIQAHTTVCGASPTTSTSAPSISVSETSAVSIPTPVLTSTGVVDTIVDPVYTETPATPAIPGYSETPVDPGNAPSSGLSTVIMGTNTVVTTPSDGSSAVTGSVPSNTAPITSGASGKFVGSVGYAVALAGAAAVLMF
ncbi:Cell wall mannoprotein CIS3 [Ceratocystis fimbriata CBS 114723]|uniref:Cell wall mannoprotein CIS3 n=1 Tax=Ceratocystis fimbriata CBS 114723 TaxID=1035309 RepID=A0A2C5WVY8_9PEZI|nr:Cell wall mannoprotein CIS3 [Ceratocystis fimbriata CBS 114723]